MASGLKLKKAAGYLAAFLPLWGFCLVRLWAVLTGHIPGRATALLALLMAGGALWLAWRLDLPQRLLRPFSSPAVSPVSPAGPPISHPIADLLLGGLALLLGGLLDTGYAMTDASGTLLDHPLLHGLSALGSGLVFSCLVLALATAARAWGRPRTGSLWQLLLLAGLVNALALFYLSGSATVYVWDNAGYWTVARSLAAAPPGLSQLREVVNTTVSLDYNHLLALPISLLMRVFGDSRWVFVLSIVNLYLLPALWGLCALAGGKRWGGLALALFFPALTYLSLVGYVDVAACAAAIWAMVFYTRQDAPWWSRGFLTGALLVLSFLLRRYFLFFAASFGAAALGLAIAKRNKGEWRSFAALFAACALWGAYLTQPFLLDKLTTDYGDLYSAYGLGLRSDLMLFCRYFGFAVLLAALLWGVYGLLARPAHRDRLTLALLQLCVCFLLLTHVQSHGQQHVLLYIPALAVLLLPWLDSPRPQSALAWALAAVCTATPLLPRPQPASIAAIQSPDPVPGFSFHGPRRSDIDQLLSLDYYLTVNCPNSSVAVCASSFLLNSETLINLYPSLAHPAPSPGVRYIYVNSVDKRDPFTWAMLDADYLVVGDPVQVHLGEENQQIIALVAHAVLDGTGLGSAYTRLPVSYTLQDGSLIYVYQRTRPVTPQERSWVSDQLTAKYPEYQALYQVP